MQSIPRVRTWRVRVEDGPIFYVTAPTKYLAKLNARFDRPFTWGKRLYISVVREK